MKQTLEVVPETLDQKKKNYDSDPKLPSGLLLAAVFLCMERISGKFTMCVKKVESLENMNSTVETILPNRYNVITRSWAVKPSSQSGSQVSGLVRYQRVRVRDRPEGKPGARCQETNRVRSQSLGSLMHTASEARQASSLYCCSAHFLSWLPGLHTSASQSVSCEELLLLGSTSCWSQPHRVPPREPSLSFL